MNSRATRGRNKCFLIWVKDWDNEIIGFLIDCKKSTVLFQKLLRLDDVGFCNIFMFYLKNLIIGFSVNESTHSATFNAA
jgi:hypothetical protein